MVRELRQMELVEAYVVLAKANGWTQLPDARQIHDELGLTVDRSTSRRWLVDLGRKYGITRRQRPRQPVPGMARLTFELPNAEVARLDQLAVAVGYNRATTVLRALRIFETLLDARSSGASITIQHADGSKERVLLT